MIKINQQEVVENLVETFLYAGKISLDLSEEYDLYFANGGDQNIKSIPETKICNKRDIKMLFGLGEKIQSSSWLLKK